MSGDRSLTPGATEPQRLKGLLKTVPQETGVQCETGSQENLFTPNTNPLFLWQLQVPAATPSPESLTPPCAR